TSGFKLTGVLNTSPNNGLAGIWQGGGRLAFEADGSAFYFETGNGSGGAPTLNAAGFPTNANYNEALVKVGADTTTSATHHDPQRHQPERQRLGPQGRRLFHPLQRRRPGRGRLGLRLRRPPAPARLGRHRRPPAPDGRRRQGGKDLPDRPRQHGALRPQQRPR